MNAVTLLREQLKSAHETQEATMADVTEQSAHFADTNKALPVGGAYAHSIISEDVVVATMFAHTTPLSTDNSLTGLSEPMPSMSDWDKHEAWYKTVKVDLTKLKEFAQKVYLATDDYLASLKDEDLDQEIDMPGMGKHSLAFFITNIVILHIANLTGEISSVKGLQGLKGYPF
ncbi:DinB family protein [Candidatus Daviesbacteria bacterium]|nr:DinB family protein [Candidatus Daviesbacteria bacterium]